MLLRAQQHDPLDLPLSPDQRQHQGLDEPRNHHRFPRVRTHLATPFHLSDGFHPLRTDPYRQPREKHPMGRC